MSGRHRLRSPTEIQRQAWSGDGFDLNFRARVNADCRVLGCTEIFGDLPYRYSTAGSPTVPHRKNKAGQNDLTGGLSCMTIRTNVREDP